MMTMSEARAAEIQTWLDEPDLLREAGQPVPEFTAAEVAEARRICAARESRYATKH